MSKDYVVSGDLKYFHLRAFSDNYTILQGKKTQTALEFLNDVQVKLGYDSDIRCHVKGKSLRDAVDVVVTKCDLKNINIGFLAFLQRVWDVFQRFLFSLGFTSFTPKIDLIHQKADAIRQHARFQSFSEFSSSGYSLFHFQKQVKGIISFFNKLSQDKRDFLGPHFPALLNENNLTTIKDCVDRAEALYNSHCALCQNKDELHPFATVSHEDKLAVRVPEFDRLFTILAKEAYENGDCQTAAYYLSKVEFPDGGRFIPDLIEKCLAEDKGTIAELAVSKIYLEDKWKLEVKIGLHLIGKREIADHVIKIVLKLAEKTRFSDTDSTLTKALIARCLKDKKYYKEAIAATEWFHFFREDKEHSSTQAAQALTDIANSCLEQDDLHTAIEANEKIQYGKRPVELQIKLIGACLKVNSIDPAHRIAVVVGDSKIQTNLLFQIAVRCLSFSQFNDAANSISWMTREHMTPEHFIAVEKAFHDCFEYRCDANALSIAHFVNGQELVCEKLFSIAKRKPELAEKALNLVNNQKFFQERDRLLALATAK